MHMYAEKEKYMRFGQWARVLCAKSPCLFTLAASAGTCRILYYCCNRMQTSWSQSNLLHIFFSYRLRTMSDEAALAWEVLKVTKDTTSVCAKRCQGLGFQLTVHILYMMVLLADVITDTVEVANYQLLLQDTQNSRSWLARNFWISWLFGVCASWCIFIYEIGIVSYSIKSLVTRNKINEKLVNKLMLAHQVLVLIFEDLFITTISGYLAFAGILPEAEVQADVSKASISVTIFACLIQWVLIWRSAFVWYIKEQRTGDVCCCGCACRDKKWWAHLLYTLLITASIGMSLFKFFSIFKPEVTANVLLRFLWIYVIIGFWLYVWVVNWAILMPLFRCCFHRRCSCRF